LAFTWTGTGAIPSSVQMHTNFPQSVDNDTAIQVIDGNVDSVLVDTGTTIPADIAALNDIAATDIVTAGAIITLSGAIVNVDLVDTTTTNTDMVGTDDAALATALSTVDANVDLILVDTDTTIPGLIAGLNDIAATDIVSAGAITTLTGAVVNVDLVDLATTTTTVTNQVTADVTAISGSTTAADNLESSTLTILRGTASGVPTTTTMPDSSLTETTNDHYKGRIIIWTSGNLFQQVTDITAYNGTTKTFTFTATTDAASASDTYVIL